MSLEIIKDINDRLQAYKEFMEAYNRGDMITIQRYGGSITIQK